MAFIEKRNITNQVVDYLRSKINDGTWLPGEKIPSENELTKQLNVSRASVRYAIQQLVAIGILESFQGKGTYLRSLPMNDIKNRMGQIYMNSEIEQLLEYRRLIEVESCKLSVKKIDEAAIERLEELFKIMTENKNNPDVFISSDMAFHKEILLATQNNLIIQSMDFIAEEIEKQHYKFNTEKGVQKAIEYHGEILEALKERNGKRAAEAMGKHLDKLRNEYYTL